MTSLFTLDSAVFFVIGFLSMLSHAVKKWAMGEIRGNIIDWYWSHPRATVLAVGACVSGIATTILTGTLTDHTVGAQVLAAWGIGYGADTVNSQGKI